MTALSDLLQEANVEGWSAREIQRRQSGQVSHSAISNYLNGRHPVPASEKVLACFAEVLRVPMTRLRAAAGQDPGAVGPWVPPEESARLSPRVHRALDELVRALAAEHREAGDGDEAAPIELLGRDRRSEMQVVQDRAARDDER